MHQEQEQHEHEEPAVASVLSSAVILTAASFFTVLMTMHKFLIPMYGGQNMLHTSLHELLIQLHQLLSFGAIPCF